MRRCGRSNSPPTSLTRFEQKAEAFCFRARGELEPDFQPINDRFGVVPRDSDGRTRCQVTLWQREALLSILRPGENAWDMEARGSERTRDMLALSYHTRENPAAAVSDVGHRARALDAGGASSLRTKPAHDHAAFSRDLHRTIRSLRKIRRAQTRRRLAPALERARGTRP